MMEALRGSFMVLWSMMVSTRVNWFWLIEPILPEWGLVRAWRKAIQSLRLRLRSGLRQRGGVFDAGLYLGLRPRLVYVGPLALGVGVGWVFCRPRSCALRRCGVLLRSSGR